MKTPTKERPKDLKNSSLNCKGRNFTGKKGFEQTPRSNLSVRKSVNPQSLTKNANSSSKKLREEHILLPRNST
jgi:hypothetical protein